MSEEFNRVISGPFSLPLIVIPDPDTGQNFTYTFPEKYTYSIVSLSFTIVASVAVFNRRLMLRFYSGNRFLFALGSSITQTSGETLVYSFFRGSLHLDNSANTHDVFYRLPAHFPIPGGIRLDSDCMDFQPADQFSSIHLFLQKWPILED